MSRALHLHVGPHFSGGQSINKLLKSMDLKGTSAPFHPLTDERLCEASRQMNCSNMQGASIVLRQLRDTLTNLTSQTVLASCEDVCGEVPAATRRKKIYSTLFDNLLLISESLKPINCVFYFFVRDRTSWAKDVYIEHLQKNRKYLSFDRFCENNRIEEIWDLVLKKCRSRFGASFIEINLGEDNKSCAASIFLSVATGMEFTQTKIEGNSHISLDVVERLEQLNRAWGSNFAVASAKHIELGFGSDRSALETVAGLEGLAERTQARVQRQTVSWLIPEIQFPLGEIWQKAIPEEDATFPEVTRATMEGQARILRFRMRGMPEPCYFLGMLISYLRRDTIHTQRALDLFLGMWKHEYTGLLVFLPTRWLISSLQTFLDHGPSEENRIIGASGYFFANMMRAYEAERALDGMAVDKTYDYIVPQQKLGGVGLDRFDLGRTDLMLNTVSMLYEVSLLDECAGRVIREFLRRVRNGHTIFSRMDQSRIAHNIEPKGFTNCWSFYRDPRDQSDVVD